MMIPDTSRRLLLVGNKWLSRDIMQAMTPYGWSITHSETPEEATSCLSENDHRVGVMLIESNSARYQRSMEELICRERVCWLAILDSSLLSHPDTRLFIHQALYAYQTLPFDPQKTHTLLESALDMANISPTVTIGRSWSSHRANEYGMVGNSAMTTRLYQAIDKIAAVEAPVLITGESGTGKELTARAIHEHSTRRSGPFNTINCGALPAGLIQSELFGHEKGAFTGASQSKAGIIESTSGGTLFFDEIGDLPLDMQVNLLRFLENHRVMRVGGLKEHPVDVRVLAATHVDLEKAVREGHFREDLYHRLNVLQVCTPALRERPEDIDPLARFFFRKFSRERSAGVRGFSRESMIVMRQYGWPGNIRELVNRVRRAMVMCDQRLITPADLGLERRQCAFRHAVMLEQARDIAEREAIRAALARNKHKILHAARELGVSRVTLYRLIEKHGIDRHSVSVDDEEADQPPRVTPLPSL
ncbi:sigma-54 dependent transcriptional regulator [Halomonas sp. LBP4]|uniref:sigma-54 dependent transcriptional regulator n=1 Tax=Halomonas sp. LBP4 TaxID=2044917 RepID=UPI0027D20400|nr:sigma-54 dependent transcriptional regulator [Halomonas sp. LBP4]